MKKRILLVISAMLLFGIGIAVFAYNTTGTDTAAAACCCKGDSCPMKKKDASATATTREKASCCDDCDCCKGDSCPMKKAGAASHAEMKMEGHESCPMMKKADASASMTAHHEAAAKDGTCSCACCAKHKTEKKTDAAI